MPSWLIRYTGSLQQTKRTDSNPGPCGIAFLMGVTGSSDRLARRVQRDDRISSSETIGRGTQSINLSRGGFDFPEESRGFVRWFTLDFDSAGFVNRDYNRE